MYSLDIIFTTEGAYGKGTFGDSYRKTASITRIQFRYILFIKYDLNLKTRLL